MAKFAAYYSWSSVYMYSGWYSLLCNHNSFLLEIVVYSGNLVYIFIEIPIHFGIFYGSYV